MLRICSSQKKIFASCPLERNVIHMLLVRNKYLLKFSEIGYKPIKKVLVANRGEIAVRVFRACSELGMETVGIYSEQDKNHIHRLKADTAFMVGKGLPPVKAYLNMEEIIDLAKAKQCDAIHPGYGFLSENSIFAQAVVDAGIRWIGPSPFVVKQMGDKVEARKAAIAAGVPVIPGTDGPVKNAEEVKAFCVKYGLPIIMKAAHGGGGRGMRVVQKMEDIAENFTRASSEALASFGNGDIFIEKYLVKPRHIEVQMLGDRLGNVTHLFERDCSVQRRHSKVVEVAPAPNLDPSIRAQIHEAAVKLGKFVGYENAGTVEFLLDASGQFYFIEVNARLQLEHTITEEITSVDIVQSQMMIASGKTLTELGLDQDQIQPNGTAIQCHITTEDPSRNFQPDTGRIELFRAGEGMGIRLDGSSTFTGAIVSPFYDSLLVKIVAHSKDLRSSAIKLSRALKEFQIRGVKTNIPFLLNVLEHDVFLDGKADTNFIDNNPHLFMFRPTKDRGHKLLKYLGELLVNGPMATFHTNIKPSLVDPVVPTESISASIPSQELLTNSSFRGFRYLLKSDGPKAFAKAVRDHAGLLLTDTTFRDAQQSLLSTRVRTYDMVKIAPYVSNHLSRLMSIEMWGGASFDTSLSYLRECPWERLERLRVLIPNIPFQMLLRGTNLLAYKNYPDNFVYKFCDLSVRTGIDIIRVYDSFNYLPNLMFAINAAGKAGAVVEATICYTGDITDMKLSKYDIKYYMRLVEELVKADIHILCIKDMTGLLKPIACEMLVSAIRDKYPQLPIHIHTHDTAGTGVLTCYSAAVSGADAVDVAADSMSGFASQPSMGAIIGAFQYTRLDTGLILEEIEEYSNYWEQVRLLYGPFDMISEMCSSNADVYVHQIPGGQHTNLFFHSKSLGIKDAFEKVKTTYALCNKLLGDIIKVTPSSKMVGDMALYMIQNNLTEEDILLRTDQLTFPQSVIKYFQGYLGQPHGGFPEPLRTQILQGRPCVETRPGLSLEPVDFEKMSAELREEFPRATDKDVMSYVLLPKATKEYLQFSEKYGPVDKLKSRVFFMGPQLGEKCEVELETGKTLNFQVLAFSKDLTSEGKREVFIELNGQLHSIFIEDKEAVKNLTFHPKADEKEPGQVGAPMPGLVLEILVNVGDKVEKGASLAVLTAMKMEMVVQAAVSGVVKSISVNEKMKVASGDLLLTIGE